MCLPEPIVGQYANIQVGCGNSKPPVHLKLVGLFSEGGDNMCLVQYFKMKNTWIFIDFGYFYDGEDVILRVFVLYGKKHCLFILLKKCMEWNF